MGFKPTEFLCNSELQFHVCYQCSKEIKEMADHGTNFFVSVVGRLQSTIWKFRSPKRTSERYNVIIIYNIIIISLFAQMYYL